MSMQRLRAFFPLLAVAVASAVLVGLSPRTDTVLAEPPSAAAQPKLALAYIYKSDKESAAGFKKLLDEAGLSLHQVRFEAVEKTDFTSYAAILIGSDTERAWGGSAKAVDKAKKPILGLGEGGYDFFGDLKLAIGARHGWHGNDTGVLPVNPSKSRFWSSSKVSTKDGKLITVYEKTNHVGIHLPKPAEDVLLIGREEKDAHHYPLVQQGSRYVLWGFTASPDQMTRAGKELFIATCRYTAALDKSPGGEKSAEKEPQKD